MSFQPLDEHFITRKPVKGEFVNKTTQLATKPSAYDYVYEDEPSGLSRFDPRTWSKKTWIIAAAALVAVIVAAVVAGVEASKSGKYPDYTALNYSFVKAYEGTDFFDNFDYFTGYDPSDGFVQ